MSEAKNILVFEPDKGMAQQISMAVWGATQITPVTANTVSEAITFILDHPDSIFAAMVEFAAAGANVLLEKLARRSIPVIAYSADTSEALQQKLMTVGIADMIVGPTNTLPISIGKSVENLARNCKETILVVDDSRSMRAALMRFLKNRCYRLLEAGDGVEALELLKKNTGVKLVITDNEMPKMDGFSLIKEIRRNFTKDELAVIGISAKTNSQVSVKFINNGANDFLHKPFLKEELYCRVDHNLEMLNRIETIRDLSNKDPLTKLFNRRYFFEHCEQFAAKNKDRILTVAMIDIDHFKRVNDTYGHTVGDMVLQKVAGTIEKAFAENGIVARFGGEEFCILTAHDHDEDIFARYDRLRREIEAGTIDIDDESITVRVSCGVCMEKSNVQTMLKAADENLYTAKDSGRNRVVLN
jgi:diguanylate cyclase (GGDEF)-like protein